ncbi:hypothetical protein DFH09DRAFT_1073162 [Mycena vulgaris]|nr:hypothetical protein DFH09DRAFT_1073162 [Mycena vulgaris]
MSPPLSHSSSPPPPSESARPRNAARAQQEHGQLDARRGGAVDFPRPFLAAGDLDGVFGGLVMEEMCKGPGGEGELPACAPGHAMRSENGACMISEKAGYPPSQNADAVERTSHVLSAMSLDALRHMPDTRRYAIPARRARCFLVMEGCLGGECEDRKAGAAEKRVWGGVGRLGATVSLSGLAGLCARPLLSASLSSLRGLAQRRAEQQNTSECENGRASTFEVGDTMRSYPYDVGRCVPYEVMLLSRTRAAAATGIEVKVNVPSPHRRA